MSQPSQHNRHNYLLRFLILLAALLVGTYLATVAVTGSTRAAAFVVVVPLIAMLVSTRNWFRSPRSMLIVVSSTLAFLALVHAWRRFIDPAGFFGPMPLHMEWLANTCVLTITVLSAGICQFMFAERDPANRANPVTSMLQLRRWRWPAFLFILVGLISLAVVVRQTKIGLTTSDLLHAIAFYEQTEPDSFTNQELSSLLAACGRETEAEALSEWMTEGGGTVVQFQSREIDLSRFDPVPWREAIQKIAEREQLVIIMEGHNAPRHRQWIEQVLPIFHAAGFSDYAAETLLEPAGALKLRGYPVISTGVYSRDPSFGNLLRTAIDLDFRLHGYESLNPDPQQREFGQAANLARLFSAHSDLKLVVHAGYAHVYKTPPESGQLLMAGHLWQMTGIEPYCILQMWHGPPEHEARQLAKLVGPGQEPVMLAPMPGGLLNPQFRVPAGAVDALVVHTPASGGPATRIHGFPSSRQRISGTWHRDQWPVLIGAWKMGEPADAIALDQVMLRQGEREFALWVPDGDYELRAFGLNGRLSVTQPDDSARD